jgi:beta-lactamase regulating signal transducer with metallopeptidase domain
MRGAAPFDAQPAVAAAATAGGSGRGQRVLADVVVGLYMVCAAGCAAWLLVGHVLLWRVTGSARDPEDWLADLFDGACRAIGAGPARLLVVSTALRPVSCGIFRPTVILGREDCNPSHAQRLRQVLLHEAAHLRQRDALGNALFNLAMPLLCFHPLYWLLRWQASLARELVADDIAAAAGTNRAAYVLDLLELARARRGHRRLLPATIGIFRSPSHFYRRMHMLMHRTTRLEPRCSTTWKFASGAACAGALLVAIATTGVRRVAAATDSAPATETTPHPSDRAVADVPPANTSDNAKADTERRDLELQIELKKEQHNALDRVRESEAMRQQLQAQLEQSEAQIEVLRAQLAVMQAQSGTGDRQSHQDTRGSKAAPDQQPRGRGQVDGGEAGEVQARVNALIVKKIQDEGKKVHNWGELNEMIRRTYRDVAGREATVDDWNVSKKFLQKFIERPASQQQGNAGFAPVNTQPQPAEKSERLSAAVGALRPTLDLLALASSYADALGNIDAAKEELGASPADKHELAAAKAKLAVAQQKARLFHSIAQAALYEAQQELALYQRQLQAGLAPPGDAFEAEGRVRILSAILGSKPAATSSEEQRPK